MMKVWLGAASACIVATSLFGCGGDNGGGGGSSSSSTTTAASSSSGGDSSQTPPQGGSALEAWLAGGDYKKWKCESAAHEARSPSPHMINRICSNAVLSADAGGTGTWKKGAAAVKELYASVTDASPMGYAVSLKIAD